MMNRAVAAALALAAALSACNGAGDVGGLPSADVQRAIDTWVAGGPGGATVALQGPDGNVELYASGVSDPDGRAMDVEAPMRVGSITKTAVAVMLLQVVDEGGLGLDDPVMRHLPELTVAEGVTVRQLLDHSSGIPDYNSDALTLAILGDMDRAWTPQEVLARVADLPPSFPPGSDHQYSSTNYIIAGLLLERVTGSSVAENLASRIVDPLGLTSTWLPPDRREPITGFTKALPGGTTTADSYRALETVVGASGAMISNAPDLAKFVAALADGTLLSDTMQAAMVQDFEKTGLGLGLEVVPLSSRVVPGKRGQATGFDCVIGFVPETDRRFVILTNQGERPVYELASRILPPRR